MNTVSSYFAAIVAFYVVAIDWRAAEAVVCCNSTSVASGGGDIVASCKNKYRTYHTVEVFGNDTCDDNQIAVPVRKCCPPGKSYDMELEICLRAEEDGDKHMRRMMHLLSDQTRVVADAVMVGYNYEQPLCDAGEMLVDVPTVVLKTLMQTYWSASDLPPEYCFDLTPSDELVARRCQPTVVVCCNSSSVESASRDVVASCQNENRTFHTIEALGSGTCDDIWPVEPIRKCCPLGQSYHMKLKLCLWAGMDGDKYLRLMIELLYYKLQAHVPYIVGYNYGRPLCDAGDVLVDVNTTDLEMLFQPYSSVLELPLGYCFDLTPSYELVAQTCHIAAVVCCKSGPVASCQNKNRTFHTIEALGRGTCDVNRTAISIRKCCAWGQYYKRQSYDRWTCGQINTYTDRRWMMQQLMQLLRNKARLVADAVMVGYNYEELLCGHPNRIVFREGYDIMLMQNKPSEFPEESCFDMSTEGMPVAQVCRRSRPCIENTCVRRCCKRMIVDGSKIPECDQNEKTFFMSIYEIDEDGRRVGRSNKTVLPYYEEFVCSHRDMLEYGFQFTEDGSLYLTYEHHIVPHAKYCVEYSQGIVTDTIVAYICDSDTVFMVERARASSIHIFYQASYVASAVCLALTRLLYNILPSLRNIRNYSVKCYIYHQFMLCIWVIYQMSVEKEKKKREVPSIRYVLLTLLLLFDEFLPHFHIQHNIAIYQYI